LPSNATALCVDADPGDALLLLLLVRRDQPRPSIPVYSRFIST
jgi:hypothetical protein